MTIIPWLSSQFPDLSQIAELGQGGQKFVYSAIHRTEGTVVLKLIKPGTGSERTEREILAVRAISSPRVPRVYDSGTIPSQWGPLIWIREQMVDGQCLRNLVAAGTKLTAFKASQLLSQVLEALTVTETNRIIHRDIKPDNLMLDTSGDFWLLDFGLARHLDMVSLTATAAQVGVGTLGYSPPEQYRNNKREIDVRTDLFGLGITAYEMIHGANPFRVGATCPQDVFRCIETKPAPNLTIHGDVSGKLGGFLASLVQRRREHRPRSAAVALQSITAIRSELSPP